MEDPTSYFSTVEHMLDQANTPSMLRSVRVSLAGMNKELRKQHGLTQHPDSVRGHDLYIRVLRKLGLLIRRDQERGLISGRGTNRSGLPASKDFYTGGNERRFSYALAEMSDEKFENYLRAHRHRKVVILNESMRLADIQGMGRSVEMNRQEILRLAETDGITVAEIGAQLGISAHWVQRVLAGAKITLPMGRTYAPPPTVNPKLDPTSVVSSSVEIILGTLPTLDQVDLTKVDPEVAAEIAKDLGPIISQLRKLSRTLKEQV